MAKQRASRISARWVLDGDITIVATSRTSLPGRLEDWANSQRNIAAARAQLGESAFAAAWAAGRALPLEQAIAEALER